MIKKAIENRERQLIQHWVEISNILDFRLNPHLKDAMDNIWKQKQKVQEDKEHLIVEYSSPWSLYSFLLYVIINIP